MGRERNWRPTEIPQQLEETVGRLAATWEANGSLKRLWAGDADLWSGADETGWLGWMEVSDNAAQLAPLEAAGTQLGLRDVVLLGMGGSSLGAEVLRAVLPAEPGSPQLHILDSTHPSTVEEVRQKIDPSRALVISSSKSGTTLETAVLQRIFEDVVPPERYVVVTDPGSPLARHSSERGNLATILSKASIGGRFSVLSPFGLVPCLLSGRSVDELLEGAREMAASCRRSSPLENPGVRLGLVLAAALAHGRAKLGIRGTGNWGPFGSWLEQLLAESLGKHGKGFVPVVRWSAAVSDQVLEISVGPSSGPEAGSVSWARLETAASGAARLGAEFYRWQFATAVCGAALGLNPFDQPDVESAKVAVRALTRELSEGGDPGALFAAAPLERSAASAPVVSYRAAADMQRLGSSLQGASGDASPDAPRRELELWLGEITSAHYLAILDYLPEGSFGSRAALSLAGRLAEQLGVAVAWGRGPRYLHSTGQAFKGGPATGHFLFLVEAGISGVRIPDDAPMCAGLHLGDVLRAQAAGDAQALVARGRPVLVLEFAGADASTAAWLEQS